ncbi:beta-1,3-galactosyltransferase 1-like isoform X2 [Crassostrea virginica]|uniref:Hexosyltransferase n=2 Tax=Crassostrea virginica TaxID=6565 RepID=A0A8B8BLA8_CRAVI|nr:beta-1,3-galactosyltransferase 1-like isoform X1 [Crassostrea virginica]
MYSPNMKKKIKVATTRALIAFILIYIICLPFRRKIDDGFQSHYRLVQSYIDSGLIPRPRTISPSCINNGENVFLLIMVPSTASNFAQRNAIRKTWGHISNIPPIVKLKFVLGKTHTSQLQDFVLTENLLYNDIIIEDVPEKYENLTQKSTAILRWTVSNCPRVRYLLKIDDDVFLNLPRLLKYLSKHPQTNTVLGCLVSHSSPFRSIFSKWRVSWDQYNEEEYPEYISGPAYLISGDVLYKLYQSTKHVPKFMFEDVYITGLCRRHIGALAKSHAEFSCGYRDKGPCGSNFLYEITGHHYSPKEVQRMWSELQNRWSDCRLVDSYFVYRVIDIFKWIFL